MTFHAIPPSQAMERPRSMTNAIDPGKGDDMTVVVRRPDIATRIIQRVAELPDRNSPEDWPEAMLVTGNELQLIIGEEIAPIVEETARLVRELRRLDEEIKTLREDAERYRFIKRHRLILSGGTQKFGWPIAPFGDECDRYIAQELATELVAQGAAKARNTAVAVLQPSLWPEESTPQNSD